MTRGRWNWCARREERCLPDAVAWEERHRFLHSSPSADGLARMARDVAGPRARVLGVRRLPGGLGSSTHAVDLEPGGRVVLKRSSRVGDPNMTAEFDRLGFARAVPVPTPEPLALDEPGSWFGTSALVMSFLPGRSHLHGGAAGSWLAQLAAALVAIHTVEVPEDPPPCLLEDHAGRGWRPPPPDRLRRTPRVEALLAGAARLQASLREEPPREVFLHHDFHPGNVTWRGGRLSGVLDWNEARLGPAASDVAYCSVDLAMTHGQRAADRFVARYQALSPVPLQDLHLWQLLWIANAMLWVGYWQLGYAELGLPNLTVATLRRRLRTTADRTLSRARPAEGS